MIRRKIKKVRKNPYIDDFFIKLLSDTITFAYPETIDSLLVYYNQGYKCDDCGEEYFGCECEKCPECRFDRCLCDLEYNDSEKMRKFAWDFAKNILDNQNLEILTKKLITEYREVAKEKEYFNKLKKSKFYVELYNTILKYRNLTTERFILKLREI